MLAEMRFFYLRTPNYHYVPAALVDYAMSYFNDRYTITLGLGMLGDIIASTFI